MILEYPNKKTENEIILNNCNELLKKDKINVDFNNLLIHGENFQILKSMLYDLELQEKIDLIYIDPPFSTNNVFKISHDKANTISSGVNDKVAYKDSLKGSDFIEFLRERLLLLRELLSNKGSIYLHIDYKIGHYVKILMDEIFGLDNFRGDITRVKCNPKNFKRKTYGNIKDLILFYTKTNDYVWNEPRIPLSDDDIKRLYAKKDEDGRRYTTVPLHAPGETKNGSTGKEWKGIYPPKGRHWRCNQNELNRLEDDGLIEWSKNGVPRKKVYADEKKKKGKLMQDIWNYKDSQNPSYPTEKNNEMIEQIIRTSSNPNDMVLDCFCGSGSTLISANRLNRRWIGVDKSVEAINVVKKRLSEIQPTLYSPKSDYKFFDLYDETS